MYYSNDSLLLCYMLMMLLKTFDFQTQDFSNKSEDPYKKK